MAGSPESGPLDHLESEVGAQLRLFNRLLISYNDFKQAHEAAMLIVEDDLFRDYPQNRTLVHALNLTAIVAYARPFGANQGSLAGSRISSEILDVLTAAERELHDIVVEDRNTMMAHSDSDSNRAFPAVVDMGYRKLVLPMNASPYANSLSPEAIEILAGMALELQEAVFARREAMEPELVKYLPSAVRKSDDA